MFIGFSPSQDVKSRNVPTSLGPGGPNVGGIANVSPEQRFVMREELGKSENHKWQVEANQLADKYKDRYGIDVGARTFVTIYVCSMVGRKYLMNSGGTAITLHKQWASVALPALWQTSLPELKIQESRLRLLG